MNGKKIRVWAAGIVAASFVSVASLTAQAGQVQTGTPQKGTTQSSTRQAGTRQTGTTQSGTEKGEHETQSISAPADADDANHSWTTDQLLTSTVHEAWLLSGRNEDQFFEMVKALSAVSAQKRGLTLPDNQEAGVKAGIWIKKEAKRDPDQLLYAVVDKAVVKVGVKSTAAATK